MKTIKLESSIFNKTLENSTKEQEAKQPIGRFVKFLFIAILMLSLYSCDRSMASGCGAWPMANSGNHKVYKGSGKVTPASYKQRGNSNQYAYYKHY